MMGPNGFEDLPEPARMLAAWFADVYVDRHFAIWQTWCAFVRSISPEQPHGFVNPRINGLQPPQMMALTLNGNDALPLANVVAIEGLQHQTGVSIAIDDENVSISSTFQPLDKSMMGVVACSTMRLSTRKLEAASAEELQCAITKCLKSVCDDAGVEYK